MTEHSKPHSTGMSDHHKAKADEPEERETAESRATSHFKFKFRVGDLVSFKSDRAIRATIVERSYRETSDSPGILVYSTSHFKDGSAVRTDAVRELELITVKDAEEEEELHEEEELKENRARKLKTSKEE